MDTCPICRCRTHLCGCSRRTIQVNNADLRAELATLRAENERLRAVVEKYAVHGETCRVRWSVKKGDSCSCGLADALAALAKGGRDE